MSRPRTLRGEVAIVGVGESGYYRHGHRMIGVLARIGSEAVDLGRRDAGVVAGREHRLQGQLEFCSRRAAALGLPRPRASVLQWGGGGAVDGVSRLGDARQPVSIGGRVRGVYGPHRGVPEPYRLLQWRLEGSTS